MSSAVARCVMLAWTGLTALPSQTGAAQVDSQPDRRVVIPRASYAASPLHAALFGRHYRALWTLPVNVPVLDLRARASGLILVRRGGGMQTRSLRFEGADGREYVFRSLDKDPSPTLPVALRGTLFHNLIQDQIHSLHPSAPLAVAALLDAAGVLHANPQLVILPDDSGLGALRDEFAGMIGFFEERPDGGPNDEPGFAGATRVIGTEALMARVEDDPTEQVDLPAYLAARLLDMFLGDWDRHADQWRWASLPAGGATRWVPIPRDRDQAFVRYDGALLWLARFQLPQLVTFGKDYPYLIGLNWNGRELDRRFLAMLEAPVWDSVAAALRDRLSDSVIAASVGRMPPEHVAHYGPWLIEALQHRRDGLPAMARRYYALLAREVDMHATDQSDVARVRHLTPDSVEVTLASCPACSAYLTRRFDTRETDEVRLYLHGGDDRAEVERVAGSLVVRVVGGGGDDVFSDRSSSRRVRFYDHRGGNQVTEPEGARLDARSYDQPAARSWPPDPFRDWGSRWLPLPWFTAGPGAGLFVGGGASYTRYGFRRAPYAKRWIVRGGYAAGAGRVRLEAIGDYRRENSSTALTVAGRFSGIEVLHFYGFGNDTPGGPRDAFAVRQEQLTLRAEVSTAPAKWLRLGVGPELRYSTTDLNAATLIARDRPYGSGPFGQVGVRVQAVADWRDQSVAPLHGGRVTVTGVVYPEVWDVTGTFATLRAEGAVYVTAPMAPHPTVALRVGGQRAVGPFPFHDAAVVGGVATVRGFAEQRFAGEGAAFVGAELRQRLTRVFVILPAELGVLGLADGGRVWSDAEAPSTWHTAVGGGLWLAVIDPGGTVSAVVARSVEATSVYVSAGFAF